MSAFIVSKPLIDCLVHAYVTDKWASSEGKDPQKLGAMLWQENYRSVNHRYNERDKAPAYRYERSTVVDPVVILKQIACYEYQTCEHPQWEASEAFKFCEGLRRMVINRLPGYEAAKWGI